MAPRSPWICSAALASLVALSPAPVRGEEQPEGSSAKQQLKSGFKEMGRAVGRGATGVGHAFRDGAKEAWRASRPAREQVKEGGREVGRASAKAGRAVGEAAKDAGRAVKSTVKGEGGGAE